MIDLAAIPTLPRGMRVHRDEVRGIWVLLAPERVLPLDDIGKAILDQVDNERSFGDIVARLAAAYNAPEVAIAGDASEFLTTLSDRRFLDIAA